MVSTQSHEMGERLFSSCFPLVRFGHFLTSEKVGAVEQHVFLTRCHAKYHDRKVAEIDSSVQKLQNKI